MDSAKHGIRISNHPVIRPDLLVDSHDVDRAIAIIKANTHDRLRFGLDTRGKESASHLLRALSSEYDVSNIAGLHIRDPPSPPRTPTRKSTARAHLVGLTGLPKGPSPEDTLFHTVPIKLFHEVPSVGRALSRWLERLLVDQVILPPDIISVGSGLESINSGLDRMRKGQISGGKLVVRLS